MAMGKKKGGRARRTPTQGFPATRIAADRSAIIRVPRPSDGGRHDSSRPACPTALGADITQRNSTYDTVVLRRSSEEQAVAQPGEFRRERFLL